MPMAVIRGASRGAFRNGLYAMRSTVTLIRPQPSMATARETRIAGSTEPTDERLGQPELSDEHRGHHRAEHEDVAVREVDQLEDAVDERVAERHERIEGAVRDADEEHAEELLRCLDGVDDEPGDDEPDESESDHRRDVFGRPSPVDYPLCVCIGRHCRLLLKND